MTDRIARMPETIQITGRSSSSIWRDEKAGTFPRRVRLGSNAVGYRMSDLQEWIGSRETVYVGDQKTEGAA